MGIVDDLRNEVHRVSWERVSSRFFSYLSEGVDEIIPDEICWELQWEKGEEVELSKALLDEGCKLELMGDSYFLVFPSEVRLTKLVDAECCSCFSDWIKQEMLDGVYYLVSENDTSVRCLREKDGCIDYAESLPKEIIEILAKKLLIDDNDW